MTNHTSLSDIKVTTSIELPKGLMDTMIVVRKDVVFNWKFPFYHVKLRRAHIRTINKRMNEAFNRTLNKQAKDMLGLNKKYL
jgi:hypothetical protein